MLLLLLFPEEDIEILTEKIEELDSTLEKEREEAVVKVQELELKNVASTNKLRAEVTLLRKIHYTFLKYSHNVLKIFPTGTTLYKKRT